MGSASGELGEAGWCRRERDDLRHVCRQDRAGEPAVERDQHGVVPCRQMEEVPVGDLPAAPETRQSTAVSARLDLADGLRGRYL